MFANLWKNLPLSLFLREKEIGMITKKRLYENQNLNPNIDPISDESLINSQSFRISQLAYFVANRILRSTTKNLPTNLNSVCAVIVLDSSQLLGEEVALANSFLSICIATALNAMEIPYSIVLFADFKYLFNLKTLKEPHSLSVIQRIIESVKVKRKGSRIADSVHYAVQNIHSEERPHRAFFVISDGLDEKLCMTETWKNTILNEPNSSFGFFFSKVKVKDSSSNKNYSIIEKVWNDFRDCGLPNLFVCPLAPFDFISNAIF